MKFGEYLRDNKNPDWADQYMDYDALKGKIDPLFKINLPY
jgi:SPX domain protein involved in polyphosphate accumulation